MALLASTVLLDVLHDKTGTTDKTNNSNSHVDGKVEFNDVYHWGVDGYGEADGGLGAAMAADLGTNGVGLGEWDFGEEFAVGAGVGGQVPASMSMPTMNMNEFAMAGPELAAFMKAMRNGSTGDMSGNGSGNGNGNGQGVRMGWGQA